MLAALSMAAGLFAQAFAGSWTCHSQGTNVAWSIDPAPGSAWTTVRWGDQTSSQGGIAYVGYVSAAHHWIYEDFHYDGSYATNTSGGPQHGWWTWQGTYYLGSRRMHGQVLWRRSSRMRIDRTFVVLANGKATPSAHDFCTIRI